MPISVCPFCQRKQIVRSELIGMYVDCERCRREFKSKELDPEEGLVKGAVHNPITLTHLLTGVGLITVLSLIVGGIVWIVTSSMERDPVVKHSSADPLSNAAHNEATPPEKVEPVPPPKKQKRWIPPELVGGTITGDTPIPDTKPGKPSSFDVQPPTTPSTIRPDSLSSPAIQSTAELPSTFPNLLFPQSDPRPEKESRYMPGYYNRRIHGFNVYISKLAYDMSDEDDRRPLGCLEQELSTISKILPPGTLKQLASVLIFVEWNHTVPRSSGEVYGVYYSADPRRLIRDGIDPRKSRAACLMSLKLAYEHKKKGFHQLILLHELSHAVHDRVLGLKNTFVKNAYDQAMSRDLYLKVKHRDGTFRPGYAGTNEREYFAEMSCAYLSQIDYHPIDRDGLKDYDSVGYELAAKVWGTPEQIEQRMKDGRSR